MNRTAIWYIVGGVALAGATLWLNQGSKRRKRDRTIDTAQIPTEFEAGPVPGIPEAAKSAGQTLAESFAVIFRRRTDKPEKPPKQQKPKVHATVIK